jgi:hypothetical protein
MRTASEASTDQISDKTSAQSVENPQRRRRRSRRAAANNSQRGRLRLFYFSLASLWGFLIGTATLLYGFSLAGTRLDLSPAAIIAMSVAVILAVVGGVVASRAYREASRRR